jgi:hypothetical protein
MAAVAREPARLTGVRRLAFTAGRERTGRLTWAQQSMLEIVMDLAPATESLNLEFAWGLRRGVGEEELLAGLLDLVVEYEALRTVYVPPPDGPGQRVLASGELAVRMIEAVPDPTASEAQAAARSLASAPFDITAELPIRVAVLSFDRRPWCVAFAVSHLVIDRAGVACLRRHLGPLLTRPSGTPPVPVLKHQPLDEAAWQESPAGARQRRRALRHHESTLRAMPQTMLPRAVGEVGPQRFRYLRFDSPALAIAVPALAGRLGVHPTAVLYGAVCAVAGYASGLDRAFLQMTTSNRSAPRARSAVGILVQHPPARISLRDATMADVITRAATAVMGAVRFGQFPVDELATLRRDVEVDRGVALDFSCWLNDRRDPTRFASCDERPGAGVLAEAASRSRWRWDGFDRASSSTYYVHVDDAEGALRLTVLFDAALLPPDEIVAWVHAVERVLCATVTTDVDVAALGDYVDLVPAERGEGWHLVDASWVHLPSVAGLVSRMAGGAHVEVFPVPAPGGTSLTAFVDSRGAPIDLDRLHLACVTALRGLRTAMAPHRYVVCAGTPTATGIAGWRHVRVLAEGTGRPCGTPGIARTTGQDD